MGDRHPGEALIGSIRSDAAVSGQEVEQVVAPNDFLTVLDEEMGGQTLECWPLLRTCC